VFHLLGDGFVARLGPIGTPARCIKLGKALGLYKDEHVAKNCTPSYLPEFIRIEVAKRVRH
jgi:hypothetical protein